MITTNNEQSLLILEIFLFGDDSLHLDAVNMENDRVTHNGITKTKIELLEEVLERMIGSEDLDYELEKALRRVESFG